MPERSAERLVDVDELRDTAHALAETVGRLRAEVERLRAEVAELANTIPNDLKGGP